jgi:DNA (cytosine-5)-methyltransferase 1
MTFGSLFAGIGGMDLGLERAGMTCSWQVEIDDYAGRVLARHWPAVRRWDDVRTFPPVADADAERKPQPKGAVGEVGRRAGDGGAAIHHREWSVDLICGGFPCQDISFAGKGAGLAGERSGLWYEFARVVRVLRPRYVLVENVAALLVRGLDAVLGTLASLGYDAEWGCVPAAAVGAPHIRDRVFIVAHARIERRQRGPRLEGARRHQAERGEAVNHAGDEGRPLPHVQRDGLEGLILAGAAARATLGSHRAACAGGQWAVDPADDPESGVGRVASRVSHRVERLRGLGNAVVPQVAEWIGRRILEHAGQHEPAGPGEGAR